jgi:bifunctional non-homologous end joining protein LigD
VVHDRAFDDPAYLFEPKYDGFRGMLYLAGQDPYFRSKQGNVLRRFAELAHDVRAELGRPEAILDGEVIALDPEGRQNFRELMAGRGNLHYAAFDLLWLDGKDFRGRPLSHRRRVLERLITVTTTVLSRVFAVEERGRDLFRAVERLDLEGIVAKRRADSYAPSTTWYKVKNRAYTQIAGRASCFTPAALG